MVHVPTSRRLQGEARGSGAQPITKHTACQTGARGNPWEFEPAWSRELSGRQFLPLVRQSFPARNQRGTQDDADEHRFIMRSSAHRLPGSRGCGHADGREPPRTVDAAEPAAGRPSMQSSMTTTAFTIEGQRVTRSLGVVRGITVRSRSIFGTIGGSLQTLIGGNITLFTELCEKTRHEAFQMMVAHAEQMGANAVIGVRYDATEVMQGVTEVLCYGTAVIVAPE